MASLYQAYGRKGNTGRVSFSMSYKLDNNLIYDMILNRVAYLPRLRLSLLKKEHLKSERKVVKTAS